MATKEALRSLTLPGILTKLERTRHIIIIETTVDTLEARIFEVDADPDPEQVTTRSEINKRNREKKTAWLDTTYVRNYPL